MRRGQLLSLCYRCKNCGTKRLFFRGTQQSDGARVWAGQRQFRLTLEKGSRHKDSGRGGGGALSRVVQPRLRGAPSRPLRAPGLHPGTRGASRPRARGPERREVPGGCPATPPPAGACPRRAWWRGAGQKDGGRDARPPRVLRAEATRLTVRARRGPARAHARPVAASPVAARPPALLPAPPSAEPDQQEVWRVRGRATGSVATPLPPRRASWEAAEPQAGSVARCSPDLSRSVVRGPDTYAGQSPKPGTISLYLLAPTQKTFESKEIGGNRFCPRDLRHFFKEGRAYTCHTTFSR